MKSVERKNSFAGSTGSKASSLKNVISVGSRHIMVLLLISAMFGVFAVYPAAAQDEPCSQCGQEEHWVDQCSGGQDEIADHKLEVGIDLDLDCQPDLNPTLLPNDLLIVNRSDPRDDSVAFPGLRSFDGHLDVIDTEIVSMSLTGGGVTLTAGGGLGQGGVLRQSLGAIAEQSGDPETADSFFDVFFEVDLGGGRYLYNQSPAVIESIIDCVPPRATYIKPPGVCLPLYTSPIPGQGTHMANLVTGRHIVNPGGEPVEVGGEVYLVDKLNILAPWVALTTVLIIGAAVVMRRRRARC
jgi:hypothetical protein